jgi:hypothetical protein
MYVLRQVPHVPDGNGLVGASRRKHILVERVEGDAVDVAVVRVGNKVGGRVGLASVPHVDLAIVADAPDHVLVLGVPRHVLHNVVVARKGGGSRKLRPGRRLGRQRRPHVPQLDRLIFAPRQQEPILVRRPRHAVPFPRVADAHTLRTKHRSFRREGRVLREVEDVHFRVGSARGDDKVLKNQRSRETERKQVSTLSPLQPHLTSENTTVVTTKIQ